jgi:hypothetical protein
VTRAAHAGPGHGSEPFKLIKLPLAVNPDCQPASESDGHGATVTPGSSSLTELCYNHNPSHIEACHWHRDSVTVPVTGSERPTGGPGPAAPGDRDVGLVIQTRHGDSESDDDHHDMNHSDCQ